MILSFHPCFSGDRNILCAGREPDADDAAAISSAAAVILPQGCTEKLYRLARSGCPNIFPDFAARYDYPGKLGQIKLFREKSVAHPHTIIYENVGILSEKTKGDFTTCPDLPFPFLLKFNWGGEGETVLFVPDAHHFRNAAATAALYERSGNFGFMLQEFIPCGSKSLRIVVIGTRRISYWRIHPHGASLVNLSRGAAIDHCAFPELKARGESAVDAFCRKTGINLAGFDLIFRSEEEAPVPLFLEINYFFGRRGLGGSAAFLDILAAEIRNWLKQLELSLSRGEGTR
jgi:ribosomal protein S6--L-glutamate ligase